MPTSPSRDQLAIATADVINSATPLEGPLLGVHPRLLCVRAPFSRLRDRLGTEPWKSRFARLQQDSEALLTTPLPDTLMGTPFPTFDVRGLGGHLISLALLFRLTDDDRYRDRLHFLMQRLTDEKDWGESLVYGHWAQGFAIALDWLWAEFDAETRGKHVETLYARSRHVFEKWATYRSGDPFGYTWNISAVVLGGLAATAACLYGERPDIAPLANMAWEKMRAQSAALGPDGVSPEGIMYGGYYASYLVVNFLLAEDLLGFDLFRTTPWFARYARSLHAQSLPRAAWKANDAFFMQGDAHGNVFGIETVVRLIAAAAHDGTAQWFADELLESGLTRMSPLSLLLHNPEVQPVSPLDRPPFDEMEDQGIVVMRGDWSGTESACAFKCGPNVGHHAARRYSHPLAGGHMQPNNGEVQIFAQGDWILTHPGYVYKNTAFHNTLLINGTGQYGEQSEWFEDLPYRQRRRYPFMERAVHHGAWDEAVADLTLAYPENLGLRRVQRHLLFLRPATWILLDTVESETPVTPTLLFHTGFPISAQNPGTFAGTGAQASAVIRFHSPAAFAATTEEQARLHTGGAAQGVMPLLRLAPVQPAARHLCVTTIQAFAAGSACPPPVHVDLAAGPNAVRIHAPDSGLALTVQLFLDTPQKEITHAAHR